MIRFVLGTEYELEKKEKEKCAPVRLSTGLLSSFFLTRLRGLNQLPSLISAVSLTCMPSSRGWISKPGGRIFRQKGVQSTRLDELHLLMPTAQKEEHENLVLSPFSALAILSESRRFARVSR